MGNMYEVEFTGVLKLTDIGGGFEKWAAIDCKVSQTGTTITAGINSLSQPTLLADGSYIAKAQVFANPTDVNWTATATITWYKNAQMQIDTKDGTKAFTVP